jgi:diguanylate cyclase (GGDEF)-like protein
MPEQRHTNVPALEYLRLFHDVGRALTSSLDLPTILRSILEQMEPFFRPESWSLLMLDEQRKDLYYAVARGTSNEALQSIRIPLGAGVPGWVAMHGEALITTGDGTNERLANGAQQMPQLHSAICLPLLARGRTLGVLQLAHPEPLALTGEAITFLYILCDYAAIAIENARAVERIQDLTITDDITQLHNQRHLAAVLPAEIARAERFLSPLSLIFLDLDSFKQINDQHGHAVGSRVLAELGQLIRRTMRTGDIAFRYGGDEFVILLPQTTRAAAQGAAQRLLNVLRTRTFLRAEGLSLRLTASLGVASYPQDGATPAALLECADRRMYAVKHTSRNGIVAEG